VASVNEKLEDALLEIEHLEKQLRLSRLEVEVHKKEAELLAFVVARDRERIAAETAMYITTAREGKIATVPPVGNVQLVDQSSSWH
jgi:hypothetical protein